MIKQSVTDEIQASLVQVLDLIQPVGIVLLVNIVRLLRNI
jgi:hypothetical protein